MKKYIIGGIGLIFALCLHHRSHTQSIGFSNYYSNTLHQIIEQNIDDSTPRLRTEESTILIPWTQYLPFVQFGDIKGSKSTYIKYEDSEDEYTNVKLSNTSTRIGIFPDFLIRKKIDKQMTKYLISRTTGLNGRNIPFLN